MKSLIHKKFIDTVPDGKKDIVYKNLSYLADLFVDNEKTFRDIPHGYFPKKFKGQSDVYTFRLGQKDADRIRFAYLKDVGVSRSDFKKSICFVEYLTHDKQNRKQGALDSREFVDYDNEKTSEHIEDSFDVNKIERCEPIEIDLNSSITAILDDNSIIELINSNDEDYLYYLNDEQYACVEETKPVLLSGSAGSGKTSVGIHKILNTPPKYETAYFTYSKSLLDNTKNIYNKYSENSGENTHFFTTTDYLLSKSNVSRKDFVTVDRFRQWIQKNGVNKFPYVSTVDPIDLWAEIHGIIKGFMGINWVRGKTSIHSLMARQTYIDLPDLYSIYDTKVRNNIYKVAKKYQEWLKANKLFDENDLARKCISQFHTTHIQKFDYVIVDEVQDLSDLVIYFLFKSVNDPSNIFFSGDIHQIINPTYFGFGHLKNLFHVEKVPYELISLSKNYRSQKNIVDLANIMANIRSQYIGKKSADYLESSIRTGDKLYFVDPKPANLIDIVETINDRHYAALIVASEDEKLRLQQYLDHDNGRIFTIHDIKGLEYSYIVCYNLISHHKQQWADIFSGLGRKNASYRYYFNLFYVAITRARNNLLIYEDNINEDLLTQIKPLFQRESVFDYEVFSLAKFSTPGEWFEEGQNLEKQEKYQQAIKAYRKAHSIGKESNSIIRCKAKQLAQDGAYNGATKEFMRGDLDAMSEDDSALLLFYAEQSENLQTRIISQLWLSAVSASELDTSLRDEGRSISELFDFNKMSNEELKIFESKYFEPKLTQYNETTLKADSILMAIKKGEYGKI